MLLVARYKSLRVQNEDRDSLGVALQRKISNSLGLRNGMTQLQVLTQRLQVRATLWQQAQSLLCPLRFKQIHLPVFQMLSFYLSNLATGKIKHFFTQQFEDDHVVLAEALTGPAGPHDVTDERGPVLRPLLLQDLPREPAPCETHSKGTDCTARFQVL